MHKMAWQPDTCIFRNFKAAICRSFDEKETIFRGWGFHFLPNREVTKKSRDYWVATNLLQILFNEIAPKMIFSALRALGVTCFFNIVARGGGGVIKFLIIK